jgi:hypothetical protein
MHTLQEFVVKGVVPAAEQLKRAENLKDLTAKRGASTTFFESFLLLHMGAEVGTFTLELARSVFSSYYENFFQSLNPPKERLDLFSNKLQVSDTRESSELKGTFPNFRVLIEQTMRGQDAFAFQRNEFRGANSLRPILQKFLAHSTRYCFRSSRPKLYERCPIYERQRLGKPMARGGLQCRTGYGRRFW